jgi:hypothetical protein
MYSSWRIWRNNWRHTLFQELFVFLLPPTSDLLFMSVGWDCVSELRPPTGLLFVPPNYIWVWGHGGMILTWENRRTRRKTCTSVICLPQIPLELTRARTQTSAMRLLLYSVLLSHPCGWVLRSESDPRYGITFAAINCKMREAKFRWLH